MSTVQIYIENNKILLRYGNTYHKRYNESSGFVRHNVTDTVNFIGNINPYEYKYPLIFIEMNNFWTVLSYNEGVLDEVGSKYDINEEDYEINSFHIIDLPNTKFIVNEYLPGRELLDLPEKLLEDLEVLTLQQLLAIYSQKTVV